ncbi:dual specificity protein phosphatase family protein [Patescibacteria group bacterium]
MVKPKPAGRNDGHVVGYTLIIDHVYVGSNLCEGAICPIHGPEFKKLGVCVEINLDDDRKEIPPDDIESYTWMPVVDGYPPSEVQLYSATAIMHEAISRKRTVYVHCQNGHGRSPTLVAAYLIRYKDMTPAEANELIMQRRPEIHIEDRQMRALENFSSELNE